MFKTTFPYRKIYFTKDCKLLDTQMLNFASEKMLSTSVALKTSWDCLAPSKVEPALQWGLFN